MEIKQTTEIRKRLTDYLESNVSSVFEFTTDCPIEERIHFIYTVIAPGICRIQFYLNFLIARIAYYIDYSPVKVLLYRLIGIRIGKRVFISPNVVIDHHFPSLIELQDDVIVGWGARIFVHEYSGKTYSVGRITIENGAVIGAFASLRCGVKIPVMTTVPWGTIVTVGE
jgi:acetyltransferase-like isoleucine patch superfamily enzyme